MAFRRMDRGESKGIDLIKPRVLFDSPAVTDCTAAHDGRGLLGVQRGHSSVRSRHHTSESWLMEQQLRRRGGGLHLGVPFRGVRHPLPPGIVPLRR